MAPGVSIMEVTSVVGIDLRQLGAAQGVLRMLLHCAFVVANVPRIALDLSVSNKWQVLCAIMHQAAAE